MAIAVVVLLAPTGCGAPRSAADHVDDALDAFRREVDAPGATVAVRRPGRPDLFAGSGEEAVSARGRFLAASVTKTFVAALVHALVAEGSLSLDSPIDRWTPEVPNAERITVRQLLSHTSGLTDEVDTAAWRAAILADTSARYDARAALELARPHATGEPGNARYANVNYLIAGVIAEEVTGRPLAEELARRFWRPLGMTATSLDPDDAQRDLVAGWFTLEDNGWGPDREDFSPGVPRTLNVATFDALATVQSAVAAAGGAVSSWQDLLTWGSALADGRALGDATATLFYGPYPITDGQTTKTGWGLGILAHACPCDLTAQPPQAVFSFHDGETIGSRTMFAVDLPSGTVIVIHANAREITDDALLELTVKIHAIVTR